MLPPLLKLEYRQFLRQVQEHLSLLVMLPTYSEHVLYLLPLAFLFSLVKVLALTSNVELRQL